MIALVLTTKNKETKHYIHSEQKNCLANLIWYVFYGLWAEMEQANTVPEKNKMGIFYSLQASKIKSRGNVMVTSLDLWEVVDSIPGHSTFM